MKIISWNIDSLNAALTGQSARAELTRRVLDQFTGYQADIIAIQETKLPVGGMSEKLRYLLEEKLPGYEMAYSLSQPPARKSYAGTLFLYRESLHPKVTLPQIGAPGTMDQEGRLITLAFPGLVINQVYTPNAGGDLNRLADRQEWDRAYRDYLMALDGENPVIAMGDYNVAHQEIDLAHPETNHESAGFTDEEREGFSNLLAGGFTDTFRALHGPIEGAYTWWAQRVRTSKVNNSGWRIDYFLVSNRLKNRIIASEMIDSGKRQDHCPLFFEIDLTDL